MPEAILRLHTDPETGERQLVVKYVSDPDALPFEHEDDHRALVEQVLEDGLDGRAVERVTVGISAEPVAEAPRPERQADEERQ